MFAPLREPRRGLVVGAVDSVVEGLVTAMGHTC